MRLDGGGVCLGFVDLGGEEWGQEMREGVAGTFSCSEGVRFKMGLQHALPTLSVDNTQK